MNDVVFRKSWNMVAETIDDSTINVGNSDTSSLTTSPIVSPSKSGCEPTEEPSLIKNDESVNETNASIASQSNENASTSSQSKITDESETKESDFNDQASTSAEDDSNNAVDESALLLLPKDVIEEEKRCMLETEQAISHMTQNRVKLADREKTKRYKHLMTLLGKSSQYASYMSEKLVKHKELNPPDTPKGGDTLREISQNTNKLKRKNPSQKTGAAKKIKTNNAESVDVHPDIPVDCYRNRLGFVVSRRQPELMCGGVMRDYQLDGLEWLVTLYKNAVNGILADEMGLGKTIQVIALMCHLREKSVFGPHLIIGPLSTLPNWISEFATFAPDVPVMLMHGNAHKRDELKRKFVNIVKSKNKSKIPIVLTSYEMPLFEKKFFSSINWGYTIVDEGHRLKNYKSLLAIELAKYKTESRLLLTGTPLQNNLTELWSLLNYLIPEIFDDLPMFESLFDFSDLGDAEKQNQLIEKEKEEQIISKMHKILEPFLLRRLKSDVNIEVPRKKEVLVYAPLTEAQEELYTATMDRTLKAVKEREEPEIIIDGKRKRKCTQQQFAYNDGWDYDEFEDFLRSKQVASDHIIVEPDGKQYYYNIKMTNRLMQLRKIINHPYLVKCPIVPGTREIIINEEMIPKSGKLLVLDALLPKLKATGHKVLLFSTFKIMLDLIEDYVIMRNYKYVRLDGDDKIEDRLVSIKQFNSDPETFVFLISTRAGGLGINLTAADTVIIFDSDWNPQVDLQAQDRCHRIGQTKPVIVYRLVTVGTIDQRIIDCATSKRRLEKLVVKNDKFKQKDNKFKKHDGTETSLTVHELKELLVSTDHKQVIYPNGLVLSDKQIEDLLDRSDLID